MKYLLNLLFLVSIVNLYGQATNSYGLKVSEKQNSAITVYADFADLAPESNLSNALISILVPAGTGHTVRVIEDQNVTSWTLHKAYSNEMTSLCNLAGAYDLVQFYQASHIPISSSAEQLMFSFKLGNECGSDADIKLIDQHSDDAIMACLTDVGVVLTGSIDKDGNDKDAPTVGNYMDVKKGAGKLKCTDLQFRSTDLKSFTVQKRNNTARLDWTTENEQDLAHFEIEASSDMIDFAYIDRVKAEGLANQSKDYLFVHADISNFEENRPNKLYYRLKLVNDDGSFTYSDIRFVRFKTQSDHAHAIAVYPNPTNDNFTIEVDLLENSIGAVNIIGLDGKIYHNFLVSDKQNKYTVDLENFKQISGIYFVHVIENENIIATDRIVITK